MNTPYDSPDYHALIRRIRDIDRHPTHNDSTLARLVTADWLEERWEDERSEFIRLSVEAERIRRGLKQPHQSSRYRAAMKRWVGVVCDDRTATWMPGTSGTFAREGGGVVTFSGSPLNAGYAGGNWRAGFVYRCFCPLAWWLEHGPAVVLRHPVCEVVITDSLTYEGRRWFLDGDLRRPADRRLVTFLVGVKRHSMGHYSWPTQGEGESSLNAAALAWAEAEADRQSPV